MTPTDAQIEALALKICNASLPALTLDESRVIAKAALTAAAEVEGRPYVTWETLDRLEAKIEKAAATEREACARVADDMQLYTAWDIAAAIRARKDA
jgi:hypothetical protein